MSRARDRQRAENGSIWRDGKLVKKEEYYASHPTREMRAEQEAKEKAEIWALRKPVPDELDPKDTDAVMAERNR